MNFSTTLTSELYIWTMLRKWRRNHYLAGRLARLSSLLRFFFEYLDFKRPNEREKTMVMATLVDWIKKQAKKDV